MSERHENVVRQDASLWAIVCEMKALDAQILAWTADNLEADRMGDTSMPHGSGAFRVASEEYNNLAKRFRTEIRDGL